MSGSPGHHRPAVQVMTTTTSKNKNNNNNNNNKKSTTNDVDEYLEKQLKRATNIEEQLEKLGSNGKTMELAQKHRHHLCEVLSDLVMTSPAFALEHDCFHRLWRNCFYNPIKDWRFRVSRDRRKHSPCLPQTQQAFSNFLKEATTLYDFLINDYLGKLVPPSTASSQSQLEQQHHEQQQQDSQEALPSQDSSVAMCDPLAPKPPFDPTFAGVVPGLYKLYIHMGDLHRYAESYNKAETYYLNASKLGPGYGNPYNQLAVVNYNRDNYCNSLYWYARSLLATHEAFTTSSGNLERLFVSNREKLQEYGRDSKPTILTDDKMMMMMNSTIPTNTSRSEKRSNKGDYQSSLKERKKSASKSFLAHFVDLQYDFFLLCQRKEDIEIFDMLENMREKMSAIAASLESIQQFYAFGDSLLCRLVVINAFSLEQARSACSSININNRHALEMTCQVNEEFLYLMGTTFASRLKVMLSKALDKVNPGKNISSVRLLLPLEILLEFVDSLCLDGNEHFGGGGAACGSGGDENYETTKANFWKAIVDVRHLVQQYVDHHHLQFPTSTGKNDPTYPSFMQLKEYQVLRGYRSFRIMNEKDSTQLHSDGFVDPAEAVEVLELNPISQSQETIGTSTGSITAGAEESKVKLFRFLMLCEKFSSPESNAPLSISKDDGSLVFVLTKNSAAADDDDDDGGDFETQEMQIDTVHMTESMDDDGGDVVLYQLPQNEVVPNAVAPGIQASQSTKSPPLSLPGGNPSSKTMGIDGQHDKSVSIQASDFEQRDVGVASAPNLPGAVNVMPPPGFGPLSTQIGQTPLGGRMINATNTQDQSSLAKESILRRIIQGQTGTGGPSRVLCALDSQVENGLWHDPSGYLKLPADQGVTIAESPHLFGGDMYTANPFAQTLQSHTNPASSNMAFGLSENGHHHHPPEETALLDSSLWNSLFGEVAATKNPWATK